MLVTDGVWCEQAERWQTNTVIAARAGTALVCDPSWTTAEIDARHAIATKHGSQGMYLLITHADEDHVCGIGSFAEAEVLAGAATAATINAGEAAANLALAATAWGLAWPGAPRVDRIVPAGSCQAGPFQLEAIDAPGHSPDGTAWLLVDAAVLLPGDYLSAVSPPLALASVRAFRATLGRLIDVLDADQASLVIPGHGPPLTATQAIAIGRADCDYLDAVLASAQDATARRLAPLEALVQVSSAGTPPRPAIPDIAIYDPHVTTARTALRELQ